MKQRFGVWALGFMALLIVINSSIFTVHQTQQALVLQFGREYHVHTQPGLKWIIPFIQEVVFLENRAVDIDLPAVHITTGDQKRLVADVYVRYRISDPLLFFRSIKPAHEVGVKMRLEPLIGSALRNTLGKSPLRHVLSSERAQIMREIQSEVKVLCKSFGLDIVDVRIIRTELPVENREAVFARMNAELGRFATENRAKGAEMAQNIRSEAERERAVMLATAQKEADTSRGEGDRKALEISVHAFSKDVDLYTYYQNLRNCEIALSEGATHAMLSTDSAWLSGLLSPFHEIRRK